KHSSLIRRITFGVVGGLWFFATAGQSGAQTCKVPSLAAPRSLIAVPPLDGRQIDFAAVTKGDFNGDGLQDVVGVTSWQENEEIYVFLNTGAGSFSGPTSYVVAQPTFHNAVSVLAKKLLENALVLLCQNY